MPNVTEPTEPGQVSPGGNDADIQYNDSGSFGGTTGFTWDGANTAVNTVNVTPTTDSAYNIGSSSTYFDTIYANNVVETGASGSSTTVTTGKFGNQLGLRLKSDANGFASFAISTAGNQDFWVKRYSTPAAFQTLDEVFGEPTVQFDGGPGAVFNPDTPGQPSGVQFAAFKIPDGTQFAYFKSDDTSGTSSVGPEGLTYDGLGYIWEASTANNTVYRYDKETGTRDSYFNVGFPPRAITWDGEYLWVAASDDLYHFTTDGTQVDTHGGFNTGAGIRALTFDGNYLWAGDFNTDTIYQLEIVGAVNKTGEKFAAPANAPHGLGFDGTYFWHADASSNTIYQTDQSGNEVSKFGASGNPHGTTWDGSYLWNSGTDNNLIYQYTSSTNITDLAYKMVEIN